MRRGFKTWAEREAASRRRELALSVTDPLPARDLLASLGARIVTPSAVRGLPSDDLKQLERVDKGSWSAVTIAGPQPIIILNDSHSAARQESNLHHEAAHLIRGHRPSRLLTVNGLTIREFDRDAEDEASWLGYCMHLPRKALLRAAQAAWTDDEIGAAFLASERLVRFRRAVTGIDRQVARIKVRART